MKFALSTLSNSVITVTLIALAASNAAHATENNIGLQNQVAPVALTQIRDADDQSDSQEGAIQTESFQTASTQIASTQIENIQKNNTLNRADATNTKTNHTEQLILKQIILNSLLVCRL